MMSLPIRTLTGGDLRAFHDHFRRHCAESGRGDIHFMPFSPAGPDGPRGLDPTALDKPLTEPGWQRWFVVETEGGEIVGHVDLKGDGLRTGLHRCELGIGIERRHRGLGHGRRLMEAAIEFARGADVLCWIDLRVFGHNRAGRALYRSLGFTETGTIVDRFRIDGESIDDVIMSLRVG